jgi:hypothetical protein
VQTAIPFWQLLTLVAIPTLMVFVGILTNRQDFNRLHAKIDSKIGAVDANFDNRFDSLATQLHNGMMMIRSILRGHEGGISKLEPLP